MSGGDTYAEWDAAYVLGSLSAADRQQYEEHLAQCRACHSAVAQIAGMPGLLAQVPAHEVLAMGPFEDEEVLLAHPPASLMPALPREPRDRARPWLVPAAAAAAALVIGGFGGYALSGVGEPTRPPLTATTAAPLRLAFSPVAPSSMTAVVDLAPSGSGTQLTVECQYAPTDPNGYDPRGAWAQYSIWVVDRRGKAVEEKTWTARPGKVMRPTAQSPLALGEIAAVEIRRVDSGETVMRAGLV